MDRDIVESSPLIDEAGDLWISHIWLQEVLPRLKPAEFWYLVRKMSGNVKVEYPKATRDRMNARLRRKGVL